MRTKQSKETDLSFDFSEIRVRVKDQGRKKYNNVALYDDQFARLEELRSLLEKKLKARVSSKSEVVDFAVKNAIKAFKIKAFKAKDD